MPESQSSIGLSQELPHTCARGVEGEEGRRRGQRRKHREGVSPPKCCPEEKGH